MIALPHFFKPCIGLLLLLAGPAAVGATTISLLGPKLEPGQSVTTWGADGSARVSEQGVLELVLAEGLRPSGAFFSFGHSLDAAQDREQLYLAFDIKGRQGGESISLNLRDGSLKGGADGYQVEATQPGGFLVTQDWQRMVLPLTDFPLTGENWSPAAAAAGALPARRPLDWSNLTGLGIGKWSGPLAVSLRNIVISSHPDTGPAKLTSAWTAPRQLDLSRGAPLNLRATFEAPTRWEIRIAQEGADRTFRGLASVATAEWDGAADSGVFREGSCKATLTYGNNGRRDTATVEFRLTGPHTPRVQVAQTGYEPGHIKTACVMGETSRKEFRVVNARTGAAVFTGQTAEPVRCKEAGDWGAVLDFSGLSAPGEYYVEVAGVGRSYRFPIREGIYGALAQQAMKSYYYQRCGMDLEPAYAGPYARKACHTNDAWVYQGCQGDRIERGPWVASRGGWHDAGDYGKKIVAASDALGYLLMTCEQFPQPVQRMRFHIPGNPATPDLLREIRYELEWMLSLQEPDGGVHALITSQDFFLTGMPAADPQPRFMVGVSSCATADLAAIMAQAARVFGPRDPPWASRCRQAAVRAWEFLERHPDMVPAGGYHDPPGIHGTGTYDDNEDRDERFWAACELWVTTGEARYDAYVRAHYTELPPELFEPPSYQHTQGFGLYTYVLSGKGEPELVKRFQGAITHYARKANGAITQSPYGIALELTPYWWNNASALRSCVALLVAERLAPRQGFAEAALRQLGYVLGCNPVDRCYVTGAGSRSVKDPWQPACALDGVAEPIPGFVLPGANLIAWDLPMQHFQEVHHLPPLKNYVDDHRAASVNEVCLNYDGPYVFVTTCFASSSR